jgi:hypothetical protein
MVIKNKYFFYSCNYIEMDEAYQKLITQYENIYGPNPNSTLFRFTNGRVQTVENDVKGLEIEVQAVDEHSKLFSQQSVEEFKKVWKKLKEIESRIPGPIVTPKPPVSNPEPEPEPPKPIKVSSKK